MPEDTVIDGETGDPLTDTEPPAGPEWPGRKLDVREWDDGDVLTFSDHTGEPSGRWIEFDRATLRDLRRWL